MFLRVISRASQTPKGWFPAKTSVLKKVFRFLGGPSMRLLLHPALKREILLSFVKLSLSSRRLLPVPHSQRSSSQDSCSHSRQKQGVNGGEFESSGVANRISGSGVSDAGFKI